MSPPTDLSRQDNEIVTNAAKAALDEDPTRLVYLVRAPLYVATDERMIAKVLGAKFIDLGTEADAALEKAGFEPFALRTGPLTDARAHAVVLGMVATLGSQLDPARINVIGNITPLLNCLHPETQRIPDVGAALKPLAKLFRIVLVVPGTIRNGKIIFISEPQPFDTVGVAVIGPDLAVVGRKI